MTAARPRARGGAAAAVVLALLGASAPAAALPAAPAAEEPAVVAVVVPLVAPLDAPPVLGAAQLAAWTAPGGLLAERLDAVAGTAATLAVDPRIPASIRLLGTDAPASAVEWLARLDALPNDSFALGWADADAAGLARIGRGELAAALSLQFAVDPGRFEGMPLPDPTASPPAAGGDPSPTDSPAPVPTDEPEGPALPTDEELLAVRSTLTASWGADGVLRTERGAYPVAEAVLFTPPPPGGSAVLAFPRVVTADPAPIGPVLARLAAIPGLSLVGLGALPAGSVEETPSPERDALLQRLAAASDAEATVATVTPDPGAFLAERRLELLTALAVGRVDAEPGAAEAFLEASRALAGAVQLADSSDLLVLSNSTGLPVTISNALDVPATVQLSARPLRPLLRIQGVPQTVTIEPGSSRIVYLPAQAVTNGQVPVLLSLTGPTGLRIGPERTIRVDLQAQWETIGIVVLGLLGIAFAVGIVRNIVKRRRAAAETAGAEPGDG